MDESLLVKAATELVATFADSDTKLTRAQNNALGKVAGLLPSENMLEPERCKKCGAIWGLDWYDGPHC